MATLLGAQLESPRLPSSRIDEVGPSRKSAAISSIWRETPRNVCFLVSILQVRVRVVSFSVSFPKHTLHAWVSFLVSILRRIR